MIQRNNNLSVLPFYPADKQDEMNHRRPYAYGSVYPLYTPLGSVPSFQAIIPHIAQNLQSAKLERVGDGQLTDVTTKMVNSGLVKQNYAAFGYDIIIYPALAPQNITTEEGQFILHITLVGGTEYVSDIFTVIADVSGMINLQWYDYADLIMDGGRIAYVDGFRNTLWLPTLLGKPEYEFEEEGEQRDGYFFPEKQISQKRYKCVFLAPEYLCDVMRLIRMSDVVMMHDNYGNAYRCDTFLITPKWEVQGDLASVEIEFTCDTVAKKIGRGYVLDNGDYNNDYNNDFDNEQ